ncbi:MAG: hypothetical protein AVDCRST_MAG68-3331, partial [uncultured Gemmatimonadetes bacterium]
AAQPRPCHSRPIRLRHRPRGRRHRHHPRHPHHHARPHRRGQRERAEQCRPAHLHAVGARAHEPRAAGAPGRLRVAGHPHHLHRGGRGAPDRERRVRGEPAAGRPAGLRVPELRVHPHRHQHGRRFHRADPHGHAGPRRRHRHGAAHADGGHRVLARRGQRERGRGALPEHGQAGGAHRPDGHGAHHLL